MVHLSFLKRTAVLFFLSFLSIGALFCQKLSEAEINQLADSALRIQLNSPESAIELAYEMLKESKAINYDKGISYALHRLASSYNYLGQNDSAIDYANQSILIRSKLKDTAALIGSYTSRSYIYEEMTLLDSAYQDMVNVLKLSQLFNENRFRIYGLLRSSELNILLDKRDSAFQNLIRAQQLLNDSSENQLHFAVLNGLGEHEYQSNNYKAAQAYFESQQDFIAEEDTSLIADNLLNLALCAEKLKEYQKAIDYYTQSKRLFLSLERTPDLIIADYNLGILHSNQKDYEKAISAFESALEYAYQVDLIEQRALSHKELADLYEKTENYTKSLFHLKEYSSLNDSIISIAKVESLNELQTKYETEQKEQRIALLAAENKASSAQKKFLITAAVVLLISLFSLGIYFLQRQRLAKRNERIAKQEIASILDEQEIKTYNAMLEGQEEERMRIASDLHDRLGSMLSTIKLMFSALEGKLVKAEDHSKNQYDKTNRLIDDACGEVRKISHNLGTGMIANFGLKKSLEELCQSLDLTGKINCNFLSYNLVENLPINIEVNLYRIAQESLNNIIKHAKAKNVTVQLNQLDDEISLTIEDDGIGFLYKKSNNGMGLGNLAKRAEKIGGSLHIDSAIGRGATIIVEVDLKKLET